jgi:asparagine synthase (glutamine-hydrolysing)
MCGITGFFTPQRVFSEPELHNMTNIIAHRGPNAEGFYFDNEIGLGHRRLSIIDLSDSANQPMMSASGRYIIVFNGEVYNYSELRQEFQLKCKTSSDTEVILQMFELFKHDAVQYFNGMFAFAIYDLHEKNLFVYRDRMGIKPLYYFWDGKNFAFASELKCLLQLNYIKSNISIDYNSVNEFLHLGYVPVPNSIYKNIKKLNSGAFIEISSSKFEINNYWNIENKILAKKNLIEDEMQAHEILRDLITSSVRYRLKSDVPFGTFLSGGIDSSIVTAVAQKQLYTQLNTFSIGFADSKHDESQYAKKIAEYLGTKHHELIVTEQDAIKLVNSLNDIYDEPYADSSAIPTLLVSKMARENVTMALSGDGGDELFMGYGSYTWAERLQNKKLQKFRKPLSFAMSFMNNKYKRVSHLINYEDISSIKSHIFSQEQYLFSRKEITNLLNPDFRNEIRIAESFNTERELTETEQQSLFDMKYYLKDDLLVKVDRASMYHSLEVRVPLLDYNIVEFALNLSPKLKIKNGVSKYLLKEVLYDFVPAHLFNRPKWGFSIPLDKWLKNDLSFLINDYLSSSEINKYGILSEQKVERLKYLFLKKNHSYLYNRIWLLIVLQKFLRGFYEHK